MPEQGDDVPLEAEVTIRLHLRNLFTRSDLFESYESFDAAVRMLLEEEGALGLLDGGIPGPDAQIIGIKEWRS